MIQRSRRGSTLIELLIVVAIIVTLIGAACPPMAQIPMNARETAAVRQVHTAQAQYYSQFGRYAISLAELGPPASGQTGPGGSGLVPKDLASGSKGGYRFALEGTPAGYRLVATPVVLGKSGRRSFYSDQTLVIRESWGEEPASEKSEPMT